MHEDPKRAQLRAALDETPPASNDLEVWAQYWDRKAAAGRELLELVERAGDLDGIKKAKDLIHATTWAAAELRKAEPAAVGPAGCVKPDLSRAVLGADAPVPRCGQPGAYELHRGGEATGTIWCAVHAEASGHLVLDVLERSVEGDGYRWVPVAKSD